MSAGSSGSSPQKADEKDPAATTSLPTPTDATVKSTTATTTEPAATEAATVSDTELEPTSSVLLQKVRDVDGVQLFVKRRSLSLNEPSSSHLLLDDDEVVQVVTDGEALRSPTGSVDAPLKPLPHDVDPLHYRQLVKGLLPLRSSFMKPHDASNTDARKSVHFSDQDGYTLSQIRLYEHQNEAPDVPLYATAYLDINEVDDSARAPGTAGTDPTLALTLRTCFTQPGVMPDFLEKVHENKVKLEFCVAHDVDMSLSGTVRVANICFHKTVFIRYTLNNWKTTERDLTAYFTYTSNPETDRFTFSLFLPEWFGVGSEMEFAVCYQAGGASTSYWDNNSGDNYRVKCLTRSSYSLPSGCETGGVLTLPWQQLI